MCSSEGSGCLPHLDRCDGNGTTNPTEPRTRLSNDYNYGDDPKLDQFVPQALAEAMCFSDCVVTLDFNPNEPGVEERKYYDPGVGLFLEVKPEDGEIAQLVECNLGGRCDDIS